MSGRSYHQHSLPRSTLTSGTFGTPLDKPDAGAGTESDGATDLKPSPSSRVPACLPDSRREHFPPNIEVALPFTQSCSLFDMVIPGGILMVRSFACIATLGSAAPAGAGVMVTVLSWYVATDTAGDSLSRGKMAHLVKPDGPLDRSTTVHGGA